MSEDLSLAAKKVQRVVSWAGILSLFIGIALTTAAVCTSIRAGWTPTGIGTFLAGISILSGIVLAQLFGWKDGVKDLVRRWYGPDVDGRGVLGKSVRVPCSMVFLGGVQLATAWQTWVVLALLTLIATETWLVWFLHPNLTVAPASASASSSLARPSLSPRIVISVYCLFFLLSSILVLVLVFGASAFIQKRRSRHSESRIRAEIFEVIDGYAAGRDARQLRAEVFHQDSGPIRIASINAAEFLGPYPLADDTAFSQALISTSKHTKWLLGDPTGDPLWLRNFLLNQRFCEYYARPFLALMIRWQYEAKRPGGHAGHMEVRLFGGLPQYRMVLSPNRAVVQRYPRFRHGRDDPPALLYSVVRKGDIHLPILANPGGASSTDLPDPETSLYKHFSDAFNAAWDNGEQLLFLELWRTERLQSLARRCGIDEDRILKRGDDPRALAKLLYERFDLADTWAAAQRGG